MPARPSMFGNLLPDAGLTVHSFAQRERVSVLRLLRRWAPPQQIDFLFSKARTRMLVYCGKLSALQKFSLSRLKKKALP